jgi:23S rRNA pseudouridine1911/1915/1917 synthase
MSIEVLYEDNHLIVVNKKAGDIVQGDKTGDAPLSDFVKKYIKDKYNKPGDVYLGTVHRLDRPTTGIVLFTRTSKALARMNLMFKEKTIQKTYWAITEKPPVNKTGTLVNFLLKNEKQNKSQVKKSAENGAKKAELSYKLIGKGENYAYIEVLPITGRHHQIRVQLSNINCIIKGDLKYGAKRSNKDGSIHLHARKLEFIHPVKKTPIRIIAPPPANDSLWKDFLTAIG